MLARDRLSEGLQFLQQRWQSEFLVGDRLTAADLTAAALLSPLALLPHYRTAYPWLFPRIIEVHHRCHEPLPPGLESSPPLAAQPNHQSQEVL
jgi:glutathione S-transferase